MPDVSAKENFDDDARSESKGEECGNVGGEQTVLLMKGILEVCG